MKKMNQRQMVLKYLQNHGTIDPMRALNEFGCFSLSQRISELKKQGHPIIAERISKQGLFGKVNYAEYHLIGKGGANG